MNRRVATLALLLAILIPSSAFAQDESIDLYGIGDQAFSINAGTILPLFIVGVDGNAFGGFSKLSLGAAGSLRWGTFLNNEMTIGVDLGGMFAMTKLDRVLVMLPVSAMYTYSFRFYPFEIILQAGLGVNVSKLEDDLHIGPVLKPGASFYWNYSGEWSFGLQTEYWFVPDIYFGRNVPPEQSAFGNFFGLTLTTLYHFQ